MVSMKPVSQRLITKIFIVVIGIVTGLGGVRLRGPCPTIFCSQCQSCNRRPLVPVCPRGQPAVPIYGEILH